MTVIAHTIAEYAALSGRLPGERAFVPTMGALHAGHMKLVERAREVVGPEGEVVVSVFVNPTQFGANEDLAQYPRPFLDDVRMCTDYGVDLVFAPLVEEMYPGGVSFDNMTMVQPSAIASILEGADRPGHFAGMLTVVAKLFNITQADHAFFGEKDYQQLSLVSAMARDLNFPLTVHGVPTVRDHDGLALSSRNVFLSDSERELALTIPQSLTAAQETQGTVADKLEAARSVLAPEIELAYLEAMTLDLTQRLNPDAIAESGRLLIAAKVGTTRLLDNCDINGSHSDNGSS